MQQDLGGIFKKIFKRKAGAHKHRSLNIGQDAYGDWQKLVILFVVVNILILGWSGYLFWQINQGNIFEAAPAPGAGADRSTLTNLKNTRALYDAREKHFEDLRVTPTSVVDPAL